MRFVIISVVSGLLIFSCSKKQTRNLFTKLSENHTGISFSNNITSTDEFNIFSYRNFYNGGGVAIADFNNDQLPDIYLISNMESNRLYLNKGNMQFEDITEQAGVGGKKAWSTGVVAADINGDRLLDIYVCNAGYNPEKSNQENELFINNGDLTFTESARDYNLNENGYTTHAAFFDYDIDGDLDVYILNNSFMPVNTLNYSNQRELDSKDWPVKDFLKGGGDKLLRNDNGKYTDVTKEAGIYSSLIGFGLGVTVGDANGDHLPDMYISNDFFERDYLYINQGDGTFNEEIEKRMEHISLASMGADMADINNDGFPEIFVSEMLPDEESRLKTEVLFESYPNYYLKLSRGFYHQYMHNTLQYNNGDESFSEISWYSGVASSDWSWGALLFDAENDGFRDIYICNGTLQDVTNQDFITFFADEVVQRMALTGEKEEIEYVMNRMPSNQQYNRFFHNNGDLKFTEIGLSSGFNTKSFSNGAAYGDLDNDGDLDLVVNNLNQEAFIYQNNSKALSDNHYVSISLRGYDKNSYALGSKIMAFNNSNVYSFYQMPSRGFQSSVDYKTILGIGDNTNVDSIVVIWPDKKKSFLFHPKVDTSYTFDYNASRTAKYINPYQTEYKNSYVKEVENIFEENIEDPYVDFMTEALIIKMLSKEGPTGAVGDINNDGTEDVFIGGSSGQASSIYLKTISGYVKQESPILDQDAHFEDTASKFFDADQDGDLDLYVGSGGNHQPQGSGMMQDRLYINDGNGNFTRDSNSLPQTINNTSVVVCFDIDADDDLDLFIGSRSIPMNYGLSPQSYIFENNGDGSFKDATLYFAPYLKSLGMITDAMVADIYGDTQDELIIVGEWMSPVILTKERSKFKILDTNLSEYSGWWYSIATDDVDNDGDKDLILGNRGENFYFTGSKEAPVKLWINDFDNNGSIEKIITRTINNRDITVPLKKELSEQVVLMNNPDLTHEEYADKAIQDLFSKELLEKSKIKTSMWFKSSVVINEGTEIFTIKALPEKVQFSSVNAILVKDVNRDGNNDLILGGNDANFMPQYSKLDASFGNILLNDGKGHYSTTSGKKTGFFVRGDIRGFLNIDSEDKEFFLTLINSQKPKLYELINEDR